MLNFADTDFSTTEDISGNELMPHGTVALFVIADVTDTRTNSNGKRFITVTFEVAEGPYTGKQIKENYYLDGKDFALQKTKILVRYVIETTLNAHLNNAGAYKISTPKALITGKVVAKVRVKGFYGDSGDWIYANEIDALATPREDSSTFKIYQACKNGEQLWQSDWKPAPAPRAGAPSGSGYGDHRDAPPATAYEGYGY